MPFLGREQRRPAAENTSGMGGAPPARLLGRMDVDGDTPASPSPILSITSKLNVVVPDTREHTVISRVKLLQVVIAFFCGSGVNFLAVHRSSHYFIRKARALRRNFIPVYFHSLLCSKNNNISHLWSALHLQSPLAGIK